MPVSGEGAIQRELGELKQQLVSLEKSHGRELGEIKDRFAEFLREEREEHGTINEQLLGARAEISELKSSLELHLAISRGARRNIAAVASLLGAGAMALALKLWDLVMTK